MTCSIMTSVGPQTDLFLPQLTSVDPKMTFFTVYFFGNPQYLIKKYFLDCMNEYVRRLASKDFPPESIPTITSSIQHRIMKAAA